MSAIVSAKKAWSIPIQHDAAAVGSTGWLAAPDEGELAVDVYQDEKNLFVTAPVAGVDPHELEISLQQDMLTIRGQREKKSQVASEDYFFQECYWGSFSRSIILPAEVQPDAVTAAVHHGILTVTLPKILRRRTIPIAITQE